MFFLPPYPFLFLKSIFKQDLVFSSCLLYVFQIVSLPLHGWCRPYACLPGLRGTLPERTKIRGQRDRFGVLEGEKMS